MPDIEITPEKLELKAGTQEVIWQETSDLKDLLYSVREKFPQMPWDGCEGGVVLIGLSVDGMFDQVVVSMPIGYDRSDLVEQMYSVRDIADDVGRGLDMIMTGKQYPALRDLLKEQETAAQLQLDDGQNNHLASDCDTHGSAPDGPVA